MRELGTFSQLANQFVSWSVSLCHPWFKTTNLPYRCPILKLPPPPCGYFWYETPFRTQKVSSLVGCGPLGQEILVNFSNRGPKNKGKKMWRFKSHLISFSEIFLSGYRMGPLRTRLMSLSPGIWEHYIGGLNPKMTSMVFLGSVCLKAFKR